MQETDIEDPSAPTSTYSSKVVRGASSATVLWLAGVVVMPLLMERPDKLNEWGDYVAGAAAPLAFLWVVVAVLLQTWELRAQREDLAISHRELILQREVSTAQAAEAKRQADFIGMQIAILEEERKDRRRANLANEFDETVEEIHTLVEDIFDGNVIGFAKSKQHGVQSALTFLISLDRKRSPTQEAVRVMEAAAQRVDPIYFEWVAGEDTAPALRALDRLLGRAIELATSTEAGSARTASLERLQLCELKASLSQIDLNPEYR